MTNGRSIPSVKNLSGKSASFRVGHEPLEGGPGALVRPGVSQQAVHVVIAQGDGEDVERELLHVEVPPEVAGLDGHAGPLGDEREAAPVGLLEEVALRSGAVVEFHGRGDQQAAAGHRRVVLPVEPALEHGPDARLPPGGGEGRADHRLLEPLDGRLEHLELELVLGPEVGEQTALREPELGRQGADRQPFQAVPAGQPHGLVEDALAGFGSLPHDGENYTNDRSIPSSEGPENKRPRHLSVAGVSRVLSVALGSPFRVTPLCHGHVEDPLTRTPPPWNRVYLLSLDHLLPGRIPHRRAPTRPVPWAAQAAWNRHVTPGRRRGP